MKRRPRLALILAAALAGSAAAVTLPAAPASADVLVPVVLNNGAQNGAETQWAETQGLPDDGGVRQFWATFLVQHTIGRTITGVKADVDFNGTDNAGTVGTTTIASLAAAGGTAQTLGIAGGGLETSRVTVPITVGKPSGFGCPIIGTRVRVIDAPIRMRVVDSTGIVSATTLTTTVKFTEDSNCLLTGDFPRLTAASQNLTEVTPGQNITYTYSCDDVDVDVFSSDDECASANIRWRRLDDGATGSLGTKTGTDDNTVNTFVTSLPSQGYYVVEAQFANANGSFPNTGGVTQGWNRLGNAVVNDAASSLSGSMTFSGSNASTPPSVNPGTAVQAVAAVGDTGGSVQAIEWDGNGDSNFSGTGVDESHYTVPTKTGGDIVTPALNATTQLRQTISTATSGLKTVNARITDNGALDAADSIRRQLTFTGTLRVNALPLAQNTSATTAEDNAVIVTLNGTDSDSQPEPLAFDIITPPAALQGTLGAVSSNQVTFSPAANFNGTATFTYRSRDGSLSTVGAWANSNVATATITVTPVNDVPSIDPHSATTNEDNPVTIHATGTDIEGDNLDYTVDTPPAHGSAACNAADNCTYTPDLDFNGTDTYTVRGTDQGTDGPPQSSTATFTITVNPVNDAPVPVNDTVNVPEDAVNFPINLNASDVDSLVLAFNGPVDDVDHGTLSCLGDTCTYSPAPDYNGPDSFTFTVTDDGPLTSTGTITINVTSVNDAPIATDQDLTTDEDVPVTTTLGGTDVDLDALSVLSLSVPTNGTAVLAGPGPNDATYQGDANFYGIDTFSFLLSDGGLTDTGHVTVTVNPVNDAPVINDQTFNATEDTPGILSLTASDVDGDLLTWSIVSGPSSALLLGTGPDVAYVPHLNFNGSDTFVVKVADPDGLSDTATITVLTAAVNDQPEAIATSVTTPEDNQVSFVLNATDVDGDILTFTAPGIGPFNGVVVCPAACTYTPDADFFGSDLITFSVDDGHGGVDSASVLIIVTPVNDAPVASPDSATLVEDTTQAFALSATDVDHDLLTYTTTSPAHGTLIGIAPNVVYVPNPNYFGPDEFSFTADDGNGSQSSASITLMVTSLNDAPVATGGSVTIPEDSTVSFQLGGTDVENDTLSYTVTSPVLVGMLSCSSTGACTYSAAPDDSGTYDVGYTVSDGTASDNGIFTIVVDPVNDPPVPSNSAVATSEDTALPITLNATDTEGDALNYGVASPPSHGELVCTTNSCVYTPDPNYNGPDSFVWQVDDATSSATTATVAITVTAVNDQPEALDTSTTTNEEQQVMFNLLANDVDGDPITYAIDTTTTHGTLVVNPTTGVATYTPAVDFNGTDTFLFKTTDPSGAFTLGRGTITVIGLPLILSRLVGDPTTAQVIVKLGSPITSANLVVLNNMRATLTGWYSHLPLPGRTITFTVDGTFICSAVTNAQGVGNCGNSVTGIGTVLGGGYRVGFAGDADYSATSAGGPFTIQIKLK